MNIQTFVGYSWEFGVTSRHYPLIDNVVNSHYLSAWQCIKIVRRIYMLITSGSERFNATVSNSLVFSFLLVFETVGLILVSFISGPLAFIGSSIYPPLSFLTTSLSSRTPCKNWICKNVTGLKELLFVHYKSAENWHLSTYWAAVLPRKHFVLFWNWMSTLKH